MVPQSHGGALRSGGSPGNRGGGRRMDRVKRMLQRDLLEVAPHLKHWANGVAVEYVEDGKLQLISPTVGERIRAVEVMDKIGNGERVAVSDVRRRMKAQLRAIHTRETWDRDELLAVLDEVWA